MGIWNLENTKKVKTHTSFQWSYFLLDSTNFSVKRKCSIFQRRVPNAVSFVVQVLKEILREIDSTLTEDDLENIIEEVDEDGSGTMDFDEFQAMMMG